MPFRRRLLLPILSVTALLAIACNASGSDRSDNGQEPIVLADGTIATATPVPVRNTGEPAAEDLSIVWETYNMLLQEYVGQAGVDPDVLAEAAVQGMLEALGDRYTAYINPDAFAIERQSFQGNFDGIGAQVEMAADGSYVIIAAPIEGSPAQAAGIRAGDKILAVDGDDAAGWSVIDAVNRIRGEKGTTVTLTVEHLGSATPVDISIVRDTIDQPSVRARMLDPEDGPYGVVRISQFTAESPREVREAVQSLLDQGAPGIVIDLRGNPGGLLTATVNIASDFLTEGLVTYEIDGTGRRDDWPVRPGGQFPDVPLVVLVDGFSASGSEVLAGALQDHGRALIIGTSTFGKGSVNLMRELSNGGGVYLTIAHWYTPDGRLIEEEGVQPDVVVRFPTGNQQTITEDVQMTAAIKQLDFQTAAAAP